METKPASTQKEVIDTAQKVVRHARALRTNEDAQWLFATLRKRADDMAEDILHKNELSSEEREALRRERLGILEAIRTAADQEEAQKRVLAQYGAGE